MSKFDEYGDVNSGYNPDEEPFSSGPDPLAEEKMYDRLLQHLIAAQGFEEDELRTLYPTNEKLMEFYQETIRAKSGPIANAGIDIPDDEDEEEMPGDDDVVLSDVDKRRVTEIKEAKARYGESLLRAKTLAEAAKTDADKKQAKQAFEEAGAHLPADQRLTYEEFEELGGKDLKALLAEIEAEDDEEDGE